MWNSASCFFISHHCAACRNRPDHSSATFFHCLLQTKSRTDKPKEAAGRSNCNMHLLQMMDPKWFETKFSMWEEKSLSSVIKLTQTKIKPDYFCWCVIRNGHVTGKDKEDPVMRLKRQRTWLAQDFYLIKPYFNHHYSLHLGNTAIIIIPYDLSLPRKPVMFTSAILSDLTNEI